MITCDIWSFTLVAMLVAAAAAFGALCGDILRGVFCNAEHADLSCREHDADGYTSITFSEPDVEGLVLDVLERLAGDNEDNALLQDKVNALRANYTALTEYSVNIETWLNKNNVEINEDNVAYLVGYDIL